MTKKKLLRRLLCLVHATCLALILSISFLPGIATAEPKDIIDPGNPQEASEERRVVREDRVERNIERDVRNDSASGDSHTLRAAGDFAKGLITGFPPGSQSVSNAVQEVINGCTTCHQPELVAKIRERLNRLGTTGQPERDKQKVLERLRDWEAKNPPASSTSTSECRRDSC